MTRGALTTFSIANDVAKYFAILPAMFWASTRRTGAAARWRVESDAPRHAAEAHLERRHFQPPRHHRAASLHCGG